MSILAVPENSITEIFRLLPLIHQVQLARSCWRMEGIFEGASLLMHRTLDFAEFAGMSTEDMKFFFRMSGKNVKQLKGVIQPNQLECFLDLVGSCCENVRSMLVDLSFLTPRQWSKALQNKNQLMELRMRQCNVSNMLPLTQLSGLKHLDLTNNEQLVDIHHLRMPVSIETINLTGCISLDDFHTTKFCKALPSLKVLNLTNVWLSTHAWQLMVADCPALEELTFTYHSVNYASIAKLPSLKKLTINVHRSIYCLGHDFLTALLRHKGNQLEHLEIQVRRNWKLTWNIEVAHLISQLSALCSLSNGHNYHMHVYGFKKFGQLQQRLNISDCPQISDHTITFLVNACPLLHEIVLEGCLSVTPNLLTLISDEINIEKRNGEITRKLPVKLYAYYTAINEKSLHNFKYPTTSNVIRVILKKKTAHYPA
ncbi:uncharacterized protein LOC115627351 [Scaptodrosophila lebanonensis]|uniref:Uncharacterized protein LOC115627351 n=1 Tax=Drosophila lebanonensis TaxID=7225 RepID=A0A6J2TS23_DROLE|nr:uncharacterized protein LOC115627351 [Scaptodrosophila lebanonensis]